MLAGVSVQRSKVVITAEGGAALIAQSEESSTAKSSTATHPSILEALRMARGLCSCSVCCVC